MKFAVAIRMVWIDAKLARTGTLNRSDIADAFGVSPQQAVNDIRSYKALPGAALTYDVHQKSYLGAGRVFDRDVRAAVTRAVWRVANLEITDA